MVEARDTRNEISGTVDNALQAGHVRGDAYVGGVHHHHVRQAEWPCRVGVVPPRASCFQQRDLDATLTGSASAGNATGASQVFAGLGGVGKTQLAAELARQRWADRQVDLLVWINAGSRQAIVSAYAAAALKIGLSAHTAERHDEEAGRLFLEWLGTTDRRWLIVLDDVQNPGHLRDLWPPQQPTGHVVVTTRRQDAALAQRGHFLEVDLFTPAEATAYLRAKLTHRPASLEGAEELAAALGFLPLALAQAAAYLTDRKLTCAAYLQRFAQQRTLQDLVPEPESLPDDHRATLATAWSLSVELADQLSPAGLARPLLEVASMLDSNGIPVAALTAPAVLTYLAAKLDRSSLVEAEVAREALHALNRLSLAAVDLEDPHHSVRVHALVQRATRDQLAEEHLSTVAHAAADALMDIWPEIERDTGYAQILRANTDALHTHTQDHLWCPDSHSVLFLAGNSRGEAGLVAEAIHYFQHLHEHAIQALGSDHADTLTSRSKLARWQAEAGDFVTAITEFEELLSDRSRVLGPDHPDTLSTRHNLASCRGAVGDVAGAVTEFQELLPSILRVSGPDHPETLSVRCSLVRWRAGAGEVNAAITEFEKLLADQSRVLGPDHPDTLITRHNLASCRGDIGDVTKAITEFKELLPSTIRVLGPDHPDTLKTRHNLAHRWGEAGDVAAAVTGYEALLADRSRVLGADHPQTLITRDSLAHWRAEAGDMAAAITEFEELLPSMRRVLGPDHPETLVTRHNLAYWQGEIGDVAAAVTEFEALLADRSRVLGPDHPDTLVTRNNVAYWRDAVRDT